MSTIKQMKLLSGEEILCDLVDVTYTEEDGEVMVIRAAFVLVATEDFENGLRYYTFRPFMMHIHDPTQILLLNTGAVICLTTPHVTVIEQYESHINQFRKEDEEKKAKLDALDKILDEMEQEDQFDNVYDFKPKLH